MAFAGVLADADVNAALAACQGKTEIYTIKYITTNLNISTFKHRKL